MNWPEALVVTVFILAFFGMIVAGILSGNV